MKDFSIICAVSTNGIIGNSETNSIPWHLPTDLKYFRNITLNKTVVMGSRTFQSIGKPLRDRRNVVITRNSEYAFKLRDQLSVDETYSSFIEVFKNERAGFLVVGGEHIYGEAIHVGPQKMYITIVDLHAEGDVRFPIDGQRFMSDAVTLQNGAKYICTRRTGWMEENKIKFQFTEFDRFIA